MESGQRGQQGQRLEGRSVLRTHRLVGGLALEAREGGFAE